jgi:hypothetical protein
LLLLCRSRLLDLWRPRRSRLRLRDACEAERLAERLRLRRRALPSLSLLPLPSRLRSLRSSRRAALPPLEPERERPERGDDADRLRPRGMMNAALRANVRTSTVYG